MVLAFSSAGVCANHTCSTATGWFSAYHLPTARHIIRMRSCGRRNSSPKTKAGAFSSATWSMRRPGGLLANLGGGSPRSQAGVTVYPFKDLLYAFDEVSPAFGLDPETLQTLGEQILGDPTIEFMIKAHNKFDPITGEWLL